MPLPEITLDGDLSDWPSDMIQYPITRVEWASLPDNESDISGKFQLGYRASENALYLAATVVDQDRSVDCGVYFDAQHSDSERRLQGFWPGIMLGPDGRKRASTSGGPG